MASIAELKKKRAEFAAKILEIASKDADLTQDDKDQMDSLKDMVMQHDDRIGRLEDAISMADVAPVENDMDDAESESKSKNKFDFNSKKTPLVKMRPMKLAKGARYANVIMGQYVANQSKSVLAGQRFIADTLGDIATAKEFESIIKTVSPLGTALDSTGGAFTAPDYVAEMIDLLYSKVVVQRSGAQVEPMPLGNLQFPRLSTSSTAAWVGENSAIASSNPTTDQIDLRFKTIASIVSISKSLIYQSPLRVQSIITNNMVRDIALKRDAAFLFNTTAGTTPLGVVPQAANVVTQTNLPSTGSVLQAVLQNLNALVAALTTSNVDVEGACFYIHPAVTAFLRGITDQVGRAYFVDELARGKLLGFNYFESTQIPTNLVVSGSPITTATGTYLTFVQPRHIIIGDTLPLQIDITDDGSYMQNGVFQSTFANFQTAIRAVSQCDIALEHTAAVAYMQVNGWSGNVANGGVEYNIQSLNQVSSGVQSENPTG